MELTGDNKYGFYIVALLSCLIVAQAIDCFKCVSISGRLVACEEPLQHNDTLRASPCKDQGQFTACIQISGVLQDTNESILVRSCGSFLPHDFDDDQPDCGALAFANRDVKGCLHKCTSDGCNSDESPGIKVD